MESKDYYGALGAASTATADELKAANRRLARMNHPDINPDPFEGRPVFPSDAPEAIALFEEHEPRRTTLTAEKESALQARIDAIQHAHGLRRITLEQAAIPNRHREHLTSLTPTASF